MIDFERKEKSIKKKCKDDTLDDLRPEYDLANLLKEGVLKKYSKRYERRKDGDERVK